jgi:hypothetical protein
MQLDIDDTVVRGDTATLPASVALVSLAADGWQVTVTRTPDSGPAGDLATLHVGGRIPVEPAAAARLRTIGLRCTDRRPVSGGRIDADKMRFRPR